MPFLTSGPSLRRLPLFFAYCPDYAGVLAKRLEVRSRHWERVKKETEEGLHGGYPLLEQGTADPSDTQSLDLVTCPRQALQALPKLSHSERLPPWTAVS